MKKTFLAFALAAMGLAGASAQSMPGAPNQPDMTIDAGQRQRIIDSAINELNKYYVFPDKAKKMEAALRQHQQRGDYNSIHSAIKLAQVLTEHLVAETDDKHLHVTYSAEPLPDMVPDQKPSAAERAEQLSNMKSMNYGLVRVERLPFNIGYLDLRAFAPARDAADAIAAAMTLVSNTNALIIDLRKNGGGEPATVAMLASYFFDERTHLNDIFYRNGNRTEQMWSSDFVPGARYGQSKDVYVLTSRHTFSAAEDFSYSLKNLKRITIVGETTGGGAHPGDFARIAPNFAMFIPNGRSISPITHTDWESTGVAPDIRATAEEAMKVAQIAILKKIADKEKHPATLARLNARIEKVQAEDTSGSMQ